MRLCLGKSGNRKRMDGLFMQAFPNQFIQVYFRETISCITCSSLTRVNWIHPVNTVIFLSDKSRHHRLQQPQTIMSQTPWDGFPPPRDAVFTQTPKSSNSSDLVQWPLVLSLSTSPSGRWARSRTAGSVRRRSTAAGGGPSLSSRAPSAGCSCPEPSGTARTPSATRRHTVNLKEWAGRLLKITVALDILHEWKKISMRHHAVLSR